MQKNSTAGQNRKDAPGRAYAPDFHRLAQKYVEAGQCVIFVDRSGSARLGNQSGLRHG